MFKLNDVVVSTIEFPAGEIMPKLGKYSATANGVNWIKWVFEDTSEVFVLCQLVDILQKSNPKTPIRLVCNYLPFARQDRYVNSGEPNSVRTLALILDNLGLDLIEVTDLHSNVFVDTLRNTRVLERKQHERLNFYLNRDEKIALVSPDQGASKKTIACADYLQVYVRAPIPIIQCLKGRDLDTGVVNKLDIFSDTKDYSDYRLIVVDDICDGGYTFIQIAKNLKELVFKYKTLELHVTHGIFSKGLKELEEYYDLITFYNDIRKS